MELEDNFDFDFNFENKLKTFNNFTMVEEIFIVAKIKDTLKNIKCINCCYLNFPIFY
jgi:hypothetical protein